MIDFHTHILHNMDDGPDSVEKSVKMLEEAYEKGTDAVVLSSHYYPKDKKSFDRYISRRDKRYAELCEAVTDKLVPKLYLGAEVNVHVDFTSFKGYKQLCISDTDYMLIEMPRSPWTEDMFETVYKLSLAGIKPIIAHVDRYLSSPAYNVGALTEFDPVFQVNSELFLTHRGRKTALELFEKNMIHVVGSDMHGMDKRKNTLPQAYIKLENNFGEEYIKYIEDNGAEILFNGDIPKRRKFPKPLKNKLFI